MSNRKLKTSAQVDEEDIDTLEIQITDDFKRASDKDFHTKIRCLLLLGKLNVRRAEAHEKKEACSFIDKSSQDFIDMEGNVCQIIDSWEEQRIAWHFKKAIKKISSHRWSHFKISALASLIVGIIIGGITIHWKNIINFFT